MKKFLFILLAIPLLAFGGDTFNTLDTPSATTSTQSGTWTVQPGNTPNTSPWLVSNNDGTTKANNIAGDSGQNAQLIAGSRKEVSFTTTTAQAVASTDVSNYAWVSVHIVTQGTSSTVNWQVSNDNVNWFSASLIATSQGTSGAVNSIATANIIYHGPITGRYFRLNVTGITAGTTAGVIEFFSTAKGIATMGVAAVQTGTWTIQPGNTANTTPWLVTSSGGTVTPSATLAGFQNALPWTIYNATPTVRTEGQGGPLQATAYGSLVTRPYSAPSNDWSYAVAAGGISNTTTAVTIQAAAGAGLRNYITGCQLSSDALGAATEFVIRDGAAGAVIWRQKIGTAGVVNGIGVTFPSPLKSTAATLLEVATLTASVTGAVYVNCQGYIAP